MTTALIGKLGATSVKARVALVSKGGVSGLSSLISRAGHDVQEYVDWTAVLAGSDGALDLVLFDDEAAVDMPDGLAMPAIQVTTGPATTVRRCFGAIALTAIEGSMEPLLGLAAELRRSMQRCLDAERLVDGVRTGSALAGRSPAMRRIHGVLSRAADSDATVLIEGPAGSGKSLASRIVHCKSRRSGKPLAVFDAHALDAESLAGALDRARGTTLVLEDIDRLQGAAQAVLVRHLKDRASARGEATPRLIATTSAHLPELVAKGAFREDLYYRLHAFPMVMPSLRERPEDIATIADAILSTSSAQSGRQEQGFTASALMLLESMPWPGNVAQLETVVRRAQALAGGAAIDREHLLTAPASAAVSAAAPGGGGLMRADTADVELSEDSIRPFEEEEQMLLSRALRATKGNVRRAAQLLGIGRATLYRKIQQYKLRLQ